MNLDRIEAILRLLQRQAYVGEVSIEGEGWSLQARKAPGMPLPPLTASLPDEELPRAPETLVIRAGVVGIYRAPDRPFSAGDLVNQGAVVGSIDSMRILNAVTSPGSGRVAEVLVEDGDAVEYGQQLFVLEPEKPVEDR